MRLPVLFVCVCCVVLHIVCLIGCYMVHIFRVGCWGRVLLLRLLARCDLLVLMLLCCTRYILVVLEVCPPCFLGTPGVCGVGS